MGLATGLAIGGSLLGGAMQAKAAKKAGRAQSNAEQARIDEWRRQYDQTRADYAPWVEAGRAALDTMERVRSGDMTDFYTSPDYEFRRDEGMRNIGNQFSVRGSGGNAMRALAEYNSNLASGEFGNWWNRTQNTANMGQNAVQGTTAAGNVATQGMGNAMSRQGDARAGSIMGQYQGINNGIQGGISNYLYYRGNNPNQPEQVIGPIDGSQVPLNQRRGF